MVFVFLCSVCFAEKPYVKIIFHVFQCLVVSKKKYQIKTIVDQQKKYGLIYGK